MSTHPKVSERSLKLYQALDIRHRYGYIPAILGRKDAAG
jgi:hypothetical protein